MSGATSTLESTLKYDRWIVISGLSFITVISWAYILSGAGMTMGDATSGPMAMAPVWSFGYALTMFLMWQVMMVAMMLPSAAPMILLVAALNRKKNTATGNPALLTGLFVSGYLIVWGGFSLAAVFLQWQMDRWALLNPMMASASAPLGAALLIAAGVYQLTPLKHACLRHCRSPLHFIGRRWRSGAGGALMMGLDHGVFCLGCCWVLMGLLFYGGVMNLAWIGGIALYVLIEKVAPAGHWIGRFSGALLILWGAAVLIRSYAGL